MIKNKNKSRLKKGLTLIEVIVTIGIFSLVSITATTVFTVCLSSWHKQKEGLDLMRNANWALKFLTNEIRQAEENSFNYTGVNEISFTIDTDTITYRKHPTNQELLVREVNGGGQETVVSNLKTSVDIFPGYADGLLEIEIYLARTSREVQLKSKIRIRNP